MGRVLSSCGKGQDTIIVLTTRRVNSVESTQTTNDSCGSILMVHIIACLIERKNKQRNNFINTEGINKREKNKANLILNIIVRLTAAPNRPRSANMPDNRTFYS